MSCALRLLLLTGVVAAIAAEDAAPVIIDLPPEPAPVAPAPPSRALTPPPPPAKPVDLPIAPVERRVIRPARPAVEPGADGTFGGFNDFRLAYTGGAKRFSLKNDQFNVPAIEGDFTSSGRVSIEWIASPGLKPVGGWLFGVIGAYQWNKGDLPGGGTLSDTEWTIDLDLGYAVPIGRNFQIELVPFVGIGGISGSIDQGGAVAKSSGMVIEWGAHLDGVYTFDNHFQIGVTGAYLGSTASLQDSADSSLSYTLGASGYTAGVFVGYRL